MKYPLAISVFSLFLLSGAAPPDKSDQAQHGGAPHVAAPASHAESHPTGGHAAHVTHHAGSHHHSHAHHSHAHYRHNRHHHHYARHHGTSYHRATINRTNANGRPAHFHTNFVAPRRFHFGIYRGPAGYVYRRWSFGEFLPREYFVRDYWIPNFVTFGLDLPPPDAVWVRYGPDAILIDENTGAILEVEYGVFF